MEELGINEGLSSTPKLRKLEAGVVADDGIASSSKSDSSVSATCLSSSIKKTGSSCSLEKRGRRMVCDEWTVVAKSQESTEVTDVTRGKGRRSCRRASGGRSSTSVNMRNKKKLTRIVITQDGIDQVRFFLGPFKKWCL